MRMSGVGMTNIVNIKCQCGGAAASACAVVVLCCCRDFSGAVLHSVRRGSGFFVINKHILSRNISPGFFFPGSKLLLGSYPPNVHLLDQM